MGENSARAEIGWTSTGQSRAELRRGERRKRKKVGEGVVVCW